MVQIRLIKKKPLLITINRDTPPAVPLPRVVDSYISTARGGRHKCSHHVLRRDIGRRANCLVSEGFIEKETCKVHPSTDRHPHAPNRNRAQDLLAARHLSCESFFLLLLISSLGHVCNHVWPVGTHTNTTDVDVSPDHVETCMPMSHKPP